MARIERKSALFTTVFFSGVGGGIGEEKISWKIPFNCRFSIDYGQITVSIWPLRNVIFVQGQALDSLQLPLCPLPRQLLPHRGRG